MGLLTPELGLFFWTLVVFLIVGFILKKFAWKPILTSLSERETGIAQSIAAADRVKNEMAQLKNENEQLMQKAREERSLMLKEAKESADAIIAKAKGETKAITDKMISDAQQQIEQQKMAALTDVKNQIGQLVIEVSQKVLRRELGNSAEQENYIKQLTNEVKLN